MFDSIGVFFSSIFSWLGTQITAGANAVYSGLVWAMEEMVKLISVFPTMKSMPEVYTIWNFMTILSISCIAVILLYLGIKSLSSSSGNSNLGRSVELKMILPRIFCAGIFIILTIPFVDILINFNNVLIEILSVKFNVIKALQYISAPTFLGNLVAIILIFFQMYMAIKIMIGYWLRVAEVVLMVVVSPAIFTLWINPNWGGYIKEWISRLVTLIFTQFIQILIMVIYGQIIYRFFYTASISSICLAASLLILMNNVPQFLTRFMAKDNSLQIIQNTYRKIRNTTHKVSTIKNKISGKLNPKTAK
jgi:uncharacterized membrane protein YphA (DoxX/SURF4 family)